MGIEDHPFIDSIKKQMGTEDNDEVNRSIDWNFLNYDRQTRQALLAEQERIIGEDDGVSLRTKAQLLNTRKRLNAVHEMMRRAGR